MLFLEAFHVFRLRVSDCCKVFERYSKRFKVGLRTLQAILEHLSYRCQREGVLGDAQNARLFFCQARKKKRGSFAREGEKLPEKIPVGR